MFEIVGPYPPRVYYAMCGRLSILPNAFFVIHILYHYISMLRYLACHDYFVNTGYNALSWKGVPVFHGWLVYIVKNSCREHACTRTYTMYVLYVKL